MQIFIETIRLHPLRASLGAIEPPDSAIIDLLRQYGPSAAPPLVVRSMGEDRWELLSGEKYWLAAPLAQIEALTAEVRELDDEAALELVQTEVRLLDPRHTGSVLNTARAAVEAKKNHGTTYRAYARQVGMSYSALSHLIRLLDCAPELVALLESNQISLGKAKVLARLPSQEQVNLLNQARRNSLTVRDVEKLVSGEIGPPTLETNQSDKASESTDMSHIAEQISNQLGTPVTVHWADGIAQLNITCHGLDVFDGVLERLGVTLEI
ncbi:hypothetical protein KO507_18250 [Gilvimarinus agarilyticus]|uniref:ParB/RepB/Spo0J family partition protein n=1 Tax=Gilvimarinus sp. 2_MG-2023 TaxID=3062666 RepID=UPI001C0A6100|nr:hypothetical protein [Gilvimarinus sp. 2_MG-2023]MBU2887712.1 hypothetical protein [Gilvimarinus agarilyticus]MDO6572359.1 hypothetical protein [Gilvimarinus sp. 2_MG-2023]